ncbi:peptidoglycan D,D-transpeptidase FtsI family protein [Brachybacterium hainanense]|uniref:Peptidoglycan D,D-transpeptidase FtsI family protein n=1 Tax=Brachybacterium hainanense TaxID=1541174 RepID=A0ABV6RFB0_9MICO
MNKPLRHVWLVIGLLFVLLFTSTTYFQVIAQGRLNADGRNARTIYNEFGRNRGPIVVDGTPIAWSEKSDDTYGYLRTYEPGSMYAHVTGYYSVVYGFGGLERSLNDTLSGEADSLFYQRVVDTLSGRDMQGATVELTLDSQAQQAAYDALGDRRGAVVALDPETGEILAMVSTPSFDPNRLSSHSTKDVRASWSELNEDPERPLTNRAIGGDLYPPGSTFKLLVAASALDSGSYTKDSVIPGPGTYPLPNSSSVMNNHAGGDQTPCGPDDQSTLQSALEQSCNTSFAMLGVELGEDQLSGTLDDYGFGDRMSIPQTVTASRIGTDLDDAQLASTSIGQYETRVTPLQMAMVAGSFAHDGVVMEPGLVKSVRTQDQRVISEFTPKERSQPLTAANAAQMRTMMVGTVEEGTGSAARIDGVEVGGKTGTAETGRGTKPHSWFVGYAQSGDRKVAVAVVVEEGGYGSKVAAPIAKDVMEAVIDR